MRGTRLRIGRPYWLECWRGKPIQFPRVTGDHDVDVVIGVGADYAWEGLFAITHDGLPYIGTHRRYPYHLFALGYGGNGMTFGFLAAQAGRWQTTSCSRSIGANVFVSRAFTETSIDLNAHHRANRPALPHVPGEPADTGITGAWVKKPPTRILWQEGVADPSLSPFIIVRFPLIMM